MRAVFLCTKILAIIPIISVFVEATSSESSQKEPYTPGFRELQARSRLVRMAVGDSTRYNLHTSDGIAEWASLMPRGGHVLHAWNGDEVQTYTVAMFHQLRCLDIIRQGYIAQELSPLLKHCLNYVRQSILCIADNHLEYVRTPSRQVTRYYEATCYDWSAVYKGAEINHAAWEETGKTAKL